MFTKKQVAAGLAILGALILLLGATSSTRAADEGQVKVEPEVLHQIETQGSTMVWVVLDEQADLSAAYQMQDWQARGQYVYESLVMTAERSQASLDGLLTKRNAVFKPYWIFNAIQVQVDQALLSELTAQPEVAQVLASRTYQLPKPLPGVDQQAIDSVEWNIVDIRAPEVWSTFGVRGEDIVVASIDSGVQFDHPALVRQYRGDLGGGSFDHNYNWFDPSEVCGQPSLVPCDNTGHGTHTMGTMVGDDGSPGQNQIGVAPMARWIAAKGCEDFFCSDTALLDSGQWILAPTDLNGENPRPDLRPHIVNNSWGGGFNDPWYQATVQAWIAAGIFPAFSNGNDGPFCETASSPGDYPESYSAGAYDINGLIAEFSARGPSLFGGEIKPNLSAPGVDVRSSVPGDMYESFSGTSMASPHVAGTVALMWSAAPILVGDIAQTRTFLDQAAVDQADLGCGGSDGDNNVFGEGRLDAFLSVENSPIGPTGELQGNVMDATTDTPLENIKIEVIGPYTRSTFTNANGDYNLILPVGSYDLTASGFGYIAQDITGIEVIEGAVTTQDIAMTPAPRHPVSGLVVDEDGNPLSQARVSILNTPIPPTFTDATGHYAIAEVPEGTYVIEADSGGCYDTHQEILIVDGPKTVDFQLGVRVDGFGYRCQLVVEDYIEADNLLPFSGDDNALNVDLPFPFVLYGQTYTSAHVMTNGFLSFITPDPYFSNTTIPTVEPPNAAIYPLWDDLIVEDPAGVWTKLVGDAPDRRFVIEWRNVTFLADFAQQVDFEVILHENGRIQTQYRNIGEGPLENGSSATIGLENESGTDAFQYSYNQPVLYDNLAVLYSFPPSAFVEGVITDSNDGLPIGGASVRAFQDGRLVRLGKTDEVGYYRMLLPLGDYELRAGKWYYPRETGNVVLDEEFEVLTQDFVLQTARVEPQPAFLDISMLPDSQRRFTVEIANTGTLPGNWHLLEFGGNRVMAQSTLSLQRNAEHDPNALTTRGMVNTRANPDWAPLIPGDVLRTWQPPGVVYTWGVGYSVDLKVWLSDIAKSPVENHEFDRFGNPTGRVWPARFGGGWAADMAYDTTRRWMCQVHVGGNNGIICWNPDTGNITKMLRGDFPWTAISQRGLAYRPDDDSFYVGGWNEGILYHIQGFSGENPGEVIDQCIPPDGFISGLSWNPSEGVLWEATNSESDTIYALNPDTCAVLATISHPDPGFNGAGLEIDESGNLWMVNQAQNRVYLVDSGIPATQDNPWLTPLPKRGVLNPGVRMQVRITVNTTGLVPGVYQGGLVLVSNSGREPALIIPISLRVIAYERTVNVGGGRYVDSAGVVWRSDRLYTSGSWGYIRGRGVVITNHAIAGTVEDGLYQDARLDPYAYRFDGVDPGVYEVFLGFAEIEALGVDERIFDVIIENDLVLPAHDIAFRVGPYRADRHTFYVRIGADERLDVRLVPRAGYRPPILNALRVLHRPDLE